MEQHTTIKNRRFRWRSFILSPLIGLLLFGFGWGIGSGVITLGSTNTPAQKDLPQDLEYRYVEEVYDRLRANYDGELALEKLQDGLKRGLTQATGDPYTEYLNAEESKEFDNELAGSFTGIGAELSREEEQITVVSPIAGYPAEKAGLKAKDIIVEIDGKSTYDLTLSEAVKRIRGPKGTVVKLTVVRDGSEELTLEITRDNINIPSVEYEIKDGNIGYLKISRFGEDTVGLATQAAEEFKRKNVQGVVVDVRNDPGGLLDASVDVAGLWLSNKTVLTERRGGVTVQTFTTDADAPLEGIPTVVLVNEGSASASEILAGALKDNNAATLIGQKTFGKGSVQKLQELRSGGTLKVTIARWYTPAGKNIDKEGIEPDIKVELTDDDYKAKRDPQLEMALKNLR